MREEKERVNTTKEVEGGEITTALLCLIAFSLLRYSPAENKPDDRRRSAAKRGS